ncbi:hypothetical protein TIFTF001_021802 [Ficus carica]|uniref:Uncharacterized protein n=1 Tax=Ficus carica TaxID=3494 RepID=A0AA88DC91_FICCA|nr:hypothetical protein TIFTF001_021802 [Ficus carica]
MMMMVVVKTVGSEEETLNLHFTRYTVNPNEFTVHHSSPALLSPRSFALIANLVPLHTDAHVLLSVALLPILHPINHLRGCRYPADEAPCEELEATSNPLEDYPLFPSSETSSASR